MIQVTRKRMVVRLAAVETRRQYSVFTAVGNNCEPVVLRSYLIT